MSEAKHAKLSASGSERWLNCPGSISLCEKFPKVPPSKYSIEGTKAHKLFELWCNHLIKTPVSFVIPNGFPKGMADAVRSGILEVEKLWNRDMEMETERVVSLAHIDGNMWGTLDLRIIEHFGKLYVLDYKHGGGVAVDVRDSKNKNAFNHNPQLVYYALASAHEFNYDFSEIIIGIIQPRALHPQGMFRTAALSVPTLKAYEEIFRKGVDRVKSHNPRFQAGDWCRWCAAKEGCAEFLRIANSNAAKAFAEF